MITDLNNKKHFAILRIVFGFVWLVDAYFKWQPSFFTGFVDYLSGGAEGQSALVQSWIHFWINLVNINPHFFAVVVAIAETAIALALIFGIFPKLVSYGGIAFALIIWSTAEGFGGPYTAGSTDIGSAIIYILVFVALILGHSWEEWSLTAKFKK